jgi:hypothetical protein
MVIDSPKNAVVSSARESVSPFTAGGATDPCFQILRSLPAPSRGIAFDDGDERVSATLEARDQRLQQQLERLIEAQRQTKPALCLD